MTQKEDNLSKQTTWQTALMLAFSDVLQGIAPKNDLVNKMAIRDLEKMSDIIKIAKDQLADNVLQFLTAVTKAYHAAAPFHLEIEKSLHEITGDNTRSIHDPTLDYALLDKAMEHAIKRIFNDPSLDPDSVTLAEVLKRIEQNNADTAIKTKSVLAPQTVFPLDKLTDTFLKRGEELTPEIQGMTIKTFKGEPAAGKKKAIPPAFVELAYQLDTKELVAVFGDGYTIQTGKISHDDFRVCIAISTLLDEKRSRGIPSYLSLNEIYKNMTACKGTPTKAQRDRIRASIEKMMFTRIKIDTTRELHLERHSLSYTGYFLPCEIIEENGFINNNPSILIHPYREPPFITFAKERGQFSTIDSSIFNKSPLSLTDENATIEDYLVKRILDMKYSKNKPKTILISTLIKECCKEVTPKLEMRAAGTAYKKQWDREQRTMKNALLFLDHLQSLKFIKRYKTEKDKILITL